MGTLRWEKERAERMRRDEHIASTERQKINLLNEAAVLESRIANLKRELDSKRAEQSAFDSAASRTELELGRADKSRLEKRGG